LKQKISHEIKNIRSLRMKIAETIDKAWVDAAVLPENQLKLSLLHTDCVAAYVFDSMRLSS